MSFELARSSNAEPSLSKQLGILAHVLPVREKTGRTVEKVSDDKIDQLSSLASGKSSTMHMLFSRVQSSL